mgnify:CR=1 FL=1
MRIKAERIIFDNYENEADYEWEELDWENTMDTLNFYDEFNKYILYGSIGRWNGVFSGGKIFNSIKDAIYYAIQDCYFIKIYDENGLLNIVCSHHDGTCHFMLKGLTDKGCDYLDNWEYNWNDKRTERKVHEQLVKRYTKNLHIAHKEYGCPIQQYVKPTKEVLKNKLYNEARSNYC